VERGHGEGAVESGSAVCGYLRVVRDEERVGAGAGERQALGHGQRQGHAVRVGGAAAQLIHQHQAGREREEREGVRESMVRERPRREGVRERAW